MIVFNWENDMARTLTKEEKREYDRLTKGAEQIRMNMDDLMNKPGSSEQPLSKEQAKRCNSHEVKGDISKSTGTNTIVVERPANAFRP